MIEKINLLPREYQVAGKVGVEERWFIIIVLLVFAGLAAAGFGGKFRIVQLARQKSSLTDTRGRLEAERKRLAAAISRMQAMAAEEEALRVRLVALSLLERERILWSEVLARVSRLVPEGAWLTSLGSYNQAAGKGLARGLRFQGKARSHAWVADFLGALEESPRFREVELISVKRGLYKDREVVDFELACRYRGAGEGSFVR